MELSINLGRKKDEDRRYRIIFKKQGKQERTIYKRIRF
jgi:hypothetical protein